jgi:hypothetical protein
VSTTTEQPTGVTAIRPFGAVQVLGATRTGQQDLPRRRLVGNGDGEMLVPYRTPVASCPYGR